MSITKEKRIKWKDTYIGDHAYIMYNYEGNNDVRIVPRAKGAIIRSTKELGGGVLNITVEAFVVRKNRFKLEKFFNDMDSNFTLIEKGDLKIEDDNGTLTLSDCYLDSWSQDSDNQRWSRFTLEFVKSLA